MGLNTLTPKVAGQVIEPTHPNEIHTALKEEFVGRNSASGAPEAGKSLGTAVFPWGTAFVGGLNVNGTTVSFANAGGNPYKIISGAKRATSTQPLFLQAAGIGNGNSATLLGLATPLTVESIGTRGTFSTNVVISGLAVAPAINNTCLVNDTSAVGQEDTKFWGESWQPKGSQNPKSITVDAMGANITAKIGQYAAFVTNGDYFIAYVKSATELVDCYRGFFFAGGSPIKRATLTDNNTITLLNLGWVFADSNGITLDVTYKNPIASFNQPSGPATGDYWFDTTLRQWKRYNGAAFVQVNRVPIGCVAMTTADCAVARSFDFDAGYSSDCTIEVRRSSASEAASTGSNGVASVNGKTVFLAFPRNTWSMVTNLAAATEMYSATEQANRYYYAYIDENGQRFFSDISPYYRGDLRGLYHPYNPWRCVFYALNNAASDFDALEWTTIGGRSGLDGQAIKDKTITNAKLADAVLTTLVAPTTATTSLVYVSTGIVRSFTGSGRPVQIIIYGKTGGTSPSCVQMVTVGSVNPNILFELRRSGVVIAGFNLTYISNDSENRTVRYKLSHVSTDFPVKDTSYNYELFWRIGGAGVNATLVGDHEIDVLEL